MLYLFHQYQYQYRVNKKSIDPFKFKSVKAYCIMRARNNKCVKKCVKTQGLPSWDNITQRTHH